MAYINVQNITFDQSIAKIEAPFNLTVRLECLKNVNEEVEWKFIFVGNTHDARHDQELDSIAMASLEYGVSEFTWEVPAPDYGKVPDMLDIFDSTIVMIVATYAGKKFFRCSYLLRQFYIDEQLQAEQPEAFQFDKMSRELKVDNPIIKLYELAWNEGSLIGNNSEFNTEIQGHSQIEDVDMLGENGVTNEQDERDRTLKELQGKD